MSFPTIVSPFPVNLELVQKVTSTRPSSLMHTLSGQRAQPQSHVLQPRATWPTPQPANHPIPYTPLSDCNSVSGLSTTAYACVDPIHQEGSPLHTTQRMTTTPGFTWQLELYIFTHCGQCNCHCSKKAQQSSPHGGQLTGLMPHEC